MTEGWGLGVWAPLPSRIPESEKQNRPHGYPYGLVKQKSRDLISSCGTDGSCSPQTAGATGRRPIWWWLGDGDQHVLMLVAFRWTLVTSSGLLGLYAQAGGGVAANWPCRLLEFISQDAIIDSPTRIRRSLALQLPKWRSGDRLQQ